MRAWAQHPYLLTSYCHLCVCIYINLTGVVAQRGSNFLHAFQWVIQCCSKWHRVSHSKVCDGCGGSPCGARHAFKVCTNLWAGLIFSSFFVQSTATTHRAGRFRTHRHTTVILWTIFYTCPTCEWVVPLFWKMCCLKFNFIYHRLLKNEKQNNNPLRHLVLRRSWRYLHTHTQHTHSYHTATVDAKNPCR